MATSLHEPVQNEYLTRAFELMSEKDFESAELELNHGLDEAQLEEDKVLTALFYSTLGVLYKIKKQFPKAWKFYEKAEKLLPDDPSLKLISARLLIEVFGQFDPAIRRCQKVIDLSPKDPPFLHQAEMAMGLAYLKKGERSKALEFLQRGMENDFAGLVSAGNIDMKLLEALLKKNLAAEECKIYLEKALAFATKTGELAYIQRFQKLLNFM